MRALACGALLAAVPGGLAAACGDDGPPAVVGVAGGDRLEPRFWTASGGARVLRAWFDRELGVECRFELATDGRLRCLPEPPLFIDWRFADDACTQILAVVPSCAPPPAFLHGRGRDSLACPGSYELPVLALGAEHTAAVYTDTGEGCVPSTLPGGHRAFATSERPAADFVAAEMAVDASGGPRRVQPYELRAGDGTTWATGIWDTARDGECNDGFITRTDGEPRCFPAEFALHYDFLWSDDTCSVAAALDLANFRPCHTATAVLTTQAPFGTHFLEIGAQVPAENVHRTDEAAVCGPVTETLPGDTYWLEGPPVDNATLPALQQVFDGKGRVRARRLVDEAGASLAAADGFYDTQVEASCHPRRFADGWVCLDGSVGWPLVDVFADPACQTPVIVTGDPAPRMALVPHERADACDLAEYEAAHEVGEALPFTEVWADFTGSCTALTLDPSARVHAVGPRLELPELTP